MNDLILQAYERLRKEGKVKRQKDLVEKLGFHKTTISEILNNKKQASESFVKKFEEVFGKLKTADTMIVEGNGNSDKEGRFESYQVRLHDEKSGKLILPANLKKEDVQLIIDFLKLMLKSME